jgi:hypothetical protein
MILRASPRHVQIAAQYFPSTRPIVKYLSSLVLTDEIVTVGRPSNS